MGSLLTQIAATVTAAIKRRVMIYGLWGASGLLVMFAAGYALNAVYTFLMFRWGGITASIAVAGGLLLGAAALALVGHFISMMPQRSAYQSLKASPAISRTTKRLTGPGARRAAASAGAGALAGAGAVFTLAKLRRAAARHSSPDRRRQGPDR